MDEIIQMIPWVIFTAVIVFGIGIAVRLEGED